MSKCTAPDGKLKLVSKSEKLTVTRQCELLEINRTSYYYTPVLPSPEQAKFEEYIKRRLDYWHTEFCWMGSRNLLLKLKQDDNIQGIGRERIRRLMREMGIFSIYPKPNLSKPGKKSKKFPYLLRRKAIWLPNQVWAIDITYIPTKKGHMYLTAIIDWYSRYIVGWVLSDTLETAPVLEAVRKAIEIYGAPAIINSDQGAQFGSDEYVKLLKSHGIRQSMDGKARWVDNVIIERWFRSLKVENIYITEYTTPKELRAGIKEYIEKYNYERPHSSFDGLRPYQVYNDKFVEAVDDGERLEQVA